MVETKIDLYTDQIELLKRFVKNNGYNWQYDPDAKTIKKFGLIANADINTGMLKVALVSQKQFDHIQKAIIEAREMETERLAILRQDL